MYFDYYYYYYYYLLVHKKWTNWLSLEQVTYLKTFAVKLFIGCKLGEFYISFWMWTDFFSKFKMWITTFELELKMAKSSSDNTRVPLSYMNMVLQNSKSISNICKLRQMTKEDRLIKGIVDKTKVILHMSHKLENMSTCLRVFHLNIV